MVIDDPSKLPPPNVPSSASTCEATRHSPKFDAIGRKTMITLTYGLSGILLAITGYLFSIDRPPLTLRLHPPEPTQTVLRAGSWPVFAAHPALVP